MAEQVREENSLLTAIKNHKDEYLPWIPDVSEALASVPQGVEVNRVSLESGPVSGDEPKIVIEGNSFSRSSVLDYQKSLGELSWVKSVDAPLQNLTSGQQVKFSFTLTRQVPMSSAEKGGDL